MGPRGKSGNGLSVKHFKPEKTIILTKKMIGGDEGASKVIMCPWGGRKFSRGKNLKIGEVRNTGKPRAVLRQMCNYAEDRFKEQPRKSTARVVKKNGSCSSTATGTSCHQKGDKRQKRKKVMGDRNVERNLEKGREQIEGKKKPHCDHGNEEQSWTRRNDRSGKRGQF